MHSCACPMASLDQTDNEWTARSVPPDEELPLRINELAERYAQVTGLEARVEELEGALASRGKDLGAGEARVEELEGALASRSKELEAGEARIEELEGALASRDKELEAGEARVEEVKAKLSARESEIQELKASTSWRVTKPLRAVSCGLRWLLRNTRRALMLTWWLGTGQFSRAATTSLPYYRRFVPLRVKALIPSKLRKVMKRRLKAIAVTLSENAPPALKKAIAAAEAASKAKDWPATCTICNPPRES